MKEINIQYDALFAIWKNRQEEKTGETIHETASGTRSEFYTEFGWKGSNHSWDRSLKEVAQIVRAYVKEKYPTYKFSVRTEYASMCQELHVELKESPIEIYKPFDDLDSDDFLEISKCLYYWDELEKIKFLDASKDEKKKILEESTNPYRFLLNDVTKSVIADVDRFVESYNFKIGPLDRPNR